ncbi:hypothetical protein CPAR01_16432 [Colletotrichum paranaense]|uniref:Uncharacterized protein n=3 Tax=Colletotrichum acutatum species complex TaxID=2707335 RepID=A0AAI9UEE5_9PEZI|nr:uncharacterized protein CPAR01_16432 [Colletotrichum paranaense]KAK0372569.1 hypothetical protein CLIM01_10064 [Colletotrichum limetticola]KAK1456822.1 hypothetical protein CMEL01_16179 [Colletotrichum melonis]KAK1516113.1 hypothetical protein CPAR01_16432 [Colletotrichum paranaense]
MLQMSQLPNRAGYSPLVPSPLNPDVHAVAPQRCHQKLREKRRQQGRGDVSPTQRLLRHKAAMAWKSEALTRESTMYTRDEILDILAECDRQDEVAARGLIVMATSNQPPWPPSSQKQQQQQKKQPKVHIRAAHWKEHEGEEYDFFCEADDDADESARQWGSLVPRLRSPFSRDTARRVALAFGLMCICGCLPALRAHGFHMYSATEAT